MLLVEILDSVQKFQIPLPRLKKRAPEQAVGRTVLLMLFGGVVLPKPFEDAWRLKLHHRAVRPHIRYAK